MPDAKGPPMQRSDEAPSDRKQAKSGGFSLIENLIACTVIAIGLVATYTLNTQSMATLRLANEESCASQVLQQRVEQLRIANWQRISSPTWVRDNILNV